MNDIRFTYDSIVNEPESSNWMLLHYPPNHSAADELRLLAAGSSGLSELKFSMSEHGLDNVYVAIYREQEDESKKRRVILINYLPIGLSGVRRARVMVQSRRLSSMMPAIQTTLTLDHISNLTSSAIYIALADPDSTHIITLNSQSSVDGEPVPEDPFLQQSGIPLPKSSHPSYSSSSDSKSHPRSQSMFSSLLKKRTKPSPSHDDPDTVIINKNDLPPPPPPKDGGKHANTISHHRPRPLPKPQPQQQHIHSPSLNQNRQATTTSSNANRDRSQSLSEFAVISRHPSGSGELTVHDHFEHMLPKPPKPQGISATTSGGSSRHSSNFIMPLPSKWSSTPVLMSTSAEARAKIRAQLKADKELEERNVIEREKERQAELRALKDKVEEDSRIEEERRREAIEAEVHRATELRREKEEMERLLEETKKEELKLKREMEKQKREEEHQRLDAWRRERENKVRELKQREEEERKAAILLRKKQVNQAVVEIKDLVKKRDKNTLENKWFCGEVSIQKLNGDTLIWRRRYWKIVGQVMLFYKSAQDANLILHSVDLRNDVKGIKEWDEGFEELEAIPYSFAMEFKDRSKDAWSMYVDSQKDKVKILALVNYHSGL